MTVAWDQSDLEALHELAAAEGILLTYHDYQGIERTARPEVLIQILQALGHAISQPSEAPRALEDLRHRQQSMPHEPVLVAWDGACPPFTLALADDLSPEGMTTTLLLEDQPETAESIDVHFKCEGERDNNLVEWTCSTKQPIPFGRHRLRIACADRVFESWLISAPTRPDGRPDADERRLGVFLPLYALQSERSLGIGDLGDLAALAEWAGVRGCSFISTLPLLATYLDEPFEPSPYVPVSRLFFNELFIDVEAAVDLIGDASIRAALDETTLRAEARRLNALDLVDYRAAMELKRPLLESIARAVYADANCRGHVEAFIQRHPELEAYARFRAAVMKHGGDWHTWPTDQRECGIDAIDFDEADRRYHLVAQWLLDRQLSDLADRLDRHGAALYLDLPVGVHAGGYDVWRDRGLFMTELDVGAPPDPLFTKGQNWATPPLHPRISRHQGHVYWQDILRTHFRHAKMLRIDHAMALQRLYCIPRGRSATEGVYVQYPAEELMAILCLEAHRAGAAVIGENLGTVPPETNEALREHGLFGMWIGQFEFRNDPACAVPSPPSGTLASLNTHDMPTFAGFCKGRDLDLNCELGIMDAELVASERTHRRALAEAVGAYASARAGLDDHANSLETMRDAVLEILASGQAELMQINLEDLWLETEPQNVPGVEAGYPSWRRRAALDLETIKSNHRFSELLQRLSGLQAGRSASLSSSPAEAT